MRPRLGKGVPGGADVKSLSYRSAACNGQAALQHRMAAQFHDNVIGRGWRCLEAADPGRNTATTSGKER
jgi:hypothetical protein